ncbi:MAG: 1,4-alpha-glucan-branching protein [Flavobacteriales bacterium]|jgi:pullulanase/glycogen debranching enzyme|nr:1,4-alpha-glucan-branching protein [Flavobacteriales bacterium]MBT3740174.1 1,4-alpha-glucan-branching protein [Flavobacteriales bacterium]MBT4102051.1 1,4-alpha-glucan-branching protein [Flavobacteriales bacterium]MBT5023775.1 1,4-alpha-glucan-branching protein [Flavobacteriales bacterium]MBT6625222.1 1,4-alpha-glucan-branching protein [Flavobacteriales bacterium]
MLKHLVLYVVLLGSLVIQGQILTIDPAFPTQNDTVTIVYNANEGNGALQSVSPVYAHAGLITTNSSSPTDWKFVQGNWGTADPNVLMTSMGNDLHAISYHLPTFHSFNASVQTVLNLAFVFRDAAGNTVGRSADGSDIYYPIYPVNAGLLTAFFKPYDFQIVALNDTLSVRVASNASSILSVYDNGVLVASDSATKLMQFDLSVSSVGQHMLVLEAEDGSSVARDTAYYLTNAPVSVQNPPAGLKDGANEINDSTVILQLHAPGKQFIYVLGDFNNFMPDSNYYMKRSVNGDKFWLSLDLQADTRYAYQYWIDGALKLADPYSELIQDPNNDGGISAASYPNPHPYHSNAAGFTSLIHPGKSDYVWKNNSFQAPLKKDLVIYEMLIRDFVHARNYATVMDTLDYLQRLGINAIELMPNSEFENNESWGYNPSFHMALDKYYGTPDMYREFIDSCHSRGIAVIMDFVFNHAFGQSPLVQMYWDAAQNQPAADNPWFNATCPHPPYCWGSDFDHLSQATKDFVDRVNLHWFDAFKIDGVRYDFTKGFGNASGGWDVTRQNLIKRMADTVWASHPNAYIILEHWADNAEEKLLSNYGLMLWGNATYNYRDAAMGWVNGSNFSYGVYQNRGWTQPHLITYMESHDEERLMYDVLTYGNNGSSSHNIRNLNVGLRRAELTSAFTYLVPGPKMLYMFSELGYDKSINNPCRVCNKSILWGYQNVLERKRLYDVTAALINLRRSHPVFTTTNFTYSFGGSTKRINLLHPNMKAIVIGNFDNSIKSMVPNFAHTGDWYDYFSGDTLSVSDPYMTLSLAPGEYRVYTDNKLQQPTITLGAQEWSLPSIVVQLQPVPSERFVDVSWAMPNPVVVHLQVRDLQGRLLLDKAWDAAQSPDAYQVDMQALPSGMHVLTLDVGGQRSQHKLIKQ